MSVRPEPSSHAKAPLPLPKASDSAISRRVLLQSAALLAGTGLGACATSRDPGSGVGVAPQRFRIGVGSCIDQRQPQPIWDAVRAASLDFFIFGGDNVYASDAPFSRDKLRAAYDAQERWAGFRAVRDSLPHLAVWDDHDYGLNDGGAGWAHAQAAKEEFLRFWRLSADDPRRSREGLYHAQFLQAGERRIQVIGLDTRWFRSPLRPTDRRDAPGRERYLPDPNPSKTMLGPVQWSWLEQRLALHADAHVLVSSIQCVVEGHGWERWGNLPLERDRLYRTVRESGARSVVIVSGDRHIGGVYRHEGSDVPYRLWEMTSSGITHPWAGASEDGPNRVGALVTVRHFGVLEFDFAASTLQLSLRGEDGAALQSHRVRLSDMSGIS